MWWWCGSAGLMWCCCSVLGRLGAGVAVLAWRWCGSAGKRWRSNDELFCLRSLLWFPLLMVLAAFFTQIYSAVRGGCWRRIDLATVRTVVDLGGCWEKPDLLSGEDCVFCDWCMLEDLLVWMAVVVDVELAVVTWMLTLRWCGRGCWHGKYELISLERLSVVVPLLLLNRDLVLSWVRWAACGGAVISRQYDTMSEESQVFVMVVCCGCWRRRFAVGCAYADWKRRLVVVFYGDLSSWMAVDS
jgi:hypothetical protein